MALRTIDAAVVQKNSLRVDELLSKLAANSGYLSRTEKPDVNSLWIAEQTSRSSLGQKRKVSAKPLDINCMLLMALKFQHMV
ncbi:hypothetical protein TNCV_4003312 [Trichonephila clavipes]|nr:hypothetical protein TNCV_4003312 [Trichonephila clavipes]